MNLPFDPNPVKKGQIWEKTRLFLQIKGISLKNCIEKSGEIEAGEPIKSTYKGKEVNKADVIGFGKYKGKTKDFVKKNDIGYFTWAKENVKNF